MIVNIGKRAQAQAERIDAQWRAAANTRHPFSSEFAEMLEDLATIEWLGQPWPTEKRPGLKRVMLKKTHVHLYYHRYPDEIRIICVWWARRRRPPKL